MKTIRLIVLILAFGLSSLSAQVQYSIPAIVVSPGASVEVPVIAKGFSNIGALSLAIEYNPSVLEFQELSAADVFMTNHIPGQIFISYADLFHVNIYGDTLAKLSFKHISGNSELIFTEECETADLTGSVLFSTYNNGKIIDEYFQSCSLGDRVWIDVNRNGIQENLEPGLQWVSVDLFTCDNQWLSYTLTDSLGYFRFTGLNPGEYYLIFRLIDNNRDFRFTIRDAGGDEELDSDAEVIDDTTAKSFCEVLNSGEVQFKLDAGVYIPENFTGSGYYLWQNYPNPFNSSTSIRFSIPARELVRISIYNIIGEKVQSLLNEIIDAGIHTVNFNAAELKSGVYFYQITTPSNNMSGKMILTR